MSTSVRAALDALRATWHRHFHVTDDTATIVPALTVVAGRFQGVDPLWIMVVTAASGMKSELVTSLREVPDTYPLSTLTAKTLVSGWGRGDDDRSLLLHLDGKVLALKDLTSLLEMDRIARQAVLSQLREIYDGAYAVEFGTGKRIDWHGRVEMIAGVTGVVDTHAEMMSLLGARFVLFRPRHTDRLRMGKRAVQTVGMPSTARKEVASATAALLALLPPMPYPVGAVDDAGADRIAAFAEIVARARGAVVRDRWTRDVTDLPEPEFPARLARQLTVAAVAHARLHDRGTPNEADYKLAHRLAWDTIPPMRLRILSTFSDTALALDQIAAAAGISETLARRTLEDLVMLGLVRRESRTADGYHWQIDPEIDDLLATALTSPAPGAPPPDPRTTGRAPGDGPPVATDDPVTVPPEQAQALSHLVRVWTWRMRMGLPLVPRPVAVEEAS